MDLKWSEYDFSKIPFDKITRVGQRSLLYRNLFTVSWLLGRYCNFRCSYCWPYARSDKKDHRPLEVLTGTMSEIKRQARERGFNSFHVSFSGGEPTLHPAYLDLLKFYSSDFENCDYQSCHMTTNLSQPLTWFEKYIKATETLHRVSITASWHREFSKKEKFCEKLIFLQQADIQVTINMVMVPTNFDKLWDEALFFHEAGINVTLKPQSNQTASKIVDGYSDEHLQKLYNGMPQRDYTAEKLKNLGRPSTRPKSKALNQSNIQIANSNVPQVMQVELTDTDQNKWYIDQAERLNSFEFNQFKGWECSSGYRSIVIREPDGAIKRSYSCHDQPLGYLEKGFKLFDSVQKCTTPSCVSSADSKIPKRRADSDLNLWP